MLSSAKKYLKILLGALMTIIAAAILAFFVQVSIKASPHNCVCGLRPIFCPIRAVIKGGNTYSIPALL